MVKVKDSRNAINKLAKKIKATALQLKTMRADLKQLKDQAKEAALLDNSKSSAHSKKLTVKKLSVSKKKPVSTRRSKAVTK